MQNTNTRRPTSTGRRRGRGRRRSPWILVLLALLLMAALAVVGTLAFQAQRKASYPLKYEDIILKYAREYNLDPNVVAAVIHTESHFDADAESYVGARGLMQVMPDTGGWIAKKLGIQNFDPDTLYDPDTNIRFGCWYLNYLYERYDGKHDVVFAAYNTGPNRISSWLEDPQYGDGQGNFIHVPNDTTRNYIEKVNSARQRYEEYYHLGA
jgi:soluble lytic murein transglycosylase